MTEKILDIISNVVNNDNQEIHLDRTLQELQIDSLGIVEIIIKIQEKLGIDITGYNFDKMENVSDIVEAVNKYQNEK